MESFLYFFQLLILTKESFVNKGRSAFDFARRFAKEKWENGIIVELPVYQ